MGVTFLEQVEDLGLAETTPPIPLTPHQIFDLISNRLHGTEYSYLLSERFRCKIFIVHVLCHGICASHIRKLEDRLNVQFIKNSINLLEAFLVVVELEEFDTQVIQAAKKAIYILKNGDLSGYVDPEPKEV